VFKKILRYNLVQVSAYVIDIGLFMVVVFLLPERLAIANFCGKAFAGVYAFIFHKYFTFRSVVGGGGKGEALRFTLLNIFTFFMSTFFLLLFTPYITDTFFSKLLADVICIGMTFLLANKLVFNVSERKP
jgi:putative flippase GtrA